MYLKSLQMYLSVCLWRPGGPPRAADPGGPAGAAATSDLCMTRRLLGAAAAASSPSDMNVEQNELPVINL